MMKVFILVLVAVSVGLSECSDYVTLPQKSYSVKQVLELFYNIKDEDLNKKCDKVDKDEKARWYKIGKAVSDLQDACVSSQHQDYNKWKNLKDSEKFKPQMNVIKTALPCATAAEVAKFFAYYENPSVKPDSVNLPQKRYTVKEVLPVFFNIKDEELNEKCDKVDTDEKARWNKIRKAIFDLQDAELAAQKEDPNKRKNLKDADKNKAQINVIKTALPCATEARVKEILQFYHQ